MRFDSTLEGLGDLLPGLLYPSVGTRFPSISNLPFAELPPPIRQTIPDWQFQAVKQMSSANGLLNVNVGSRTLVIQAVRPYPGWKAFRETIAVVLDAVSKLDVIGKVWRYSLRYQNVLDAASVASISDLKVEVRLGGRPPLEAGFTIRAEYDHEGTRAVIQIATGAEFGMAIKGTQQPTLRGTLVDVDVMNLAPPHDFLARHVALLDALHEVEKDVFFDLLTTPVIDRLQPVWEEE